MKHYPEKCGSKSTSSSHTGHFQEVTINLPRWPGITSEKVPIGFERGQLVELLEHVATLGEGGDFWMVAKELIDFPEKAWGDGACSHVVAKLVIVAVGK